MKINIYLGRLALLLAMIGGAQASEKCSITETFPGPSTGAGISRDNWLSPAYQRYGATHADQFMPIREIRCPHPRTPLVTARTTLDLNAITGTDPFDKTSRSLEFLLDTRLYANGIIVLSRNEILAERYWNDLAKDKPQLLQDGSRAVLALLGAIAIEQGKLGATQPITRSLPSLAKTTSLRKISVRRFLDPEAFFAWTPAQMQAWTNASGWTGNDSKGVRTWLTQTDWKRRPVAGDARRTTIAPEDDLLAWMIASAFEMPTAQVMANTLLPELKPESPVYWLTDTQGTDLAGGIAFSLRDLARFGKVLIDARNSGHSAVPKWFVETLLAPSKARNVTQDRAYVIAPTEVQRFGFIRLKPTANEYVLLGGHGTSLYLDFDRQIVIAILATHPAKDGPVVTDTLIETWQRILANVHTSGS